MPKMLEIVFKSFQISHLSRERLTRGLVNTVAYSSQLAIHFKLY